MHESLCGVLALVAAAGLALPMFGQNTAPKQEKTKQPIMPYTAEYRDTIVRTLADGATITLESSSALANDSQGRTMSSITEFPGNQDGEQITRVVVIDPVAGTQTTWTSPGARAIVTAMPVHQPGQEDCYIFFTTPADSTSDAPVDTETAGPVRSVVGKPVGVAMKSSSDPDMIRARTKPVFTTVVEDLGKTTIEGIEARGKRITRTTPPGAAGNDQPLVSTEETWRATGNSPKSLLLRKVSNDPQFGKSTTELMNLSFDEPDISTFQPPEGYEIVTRKMHSAPCPKALKSDQ